MMLQCFAAILHSWWWETHAKDGGVSSLMALWASLFKPWTTVLGFSRETDLQGNCIYGIDSFDYGGWAVPWSAVCKQESQWCKFQSESKGWRSRRAHGKSHFEGGRGPAFQLHGQAERAASPLPHLLFCSGPRQIGWGPSTLESNLLLSPPIQMFISSTNTLTDTPRVTFNQTSGHPARSQVDP